MKKSLLFLISILTSLTIQAVEVDFIYKDVTCRYSITGTEKADLIQGPTTSATLVEIPGTIEDSEHNKYTVTAIAQDAFLNNTTVNEVIISENITNIGKSAFKGCSQLKKITLPKTLGTIGQDAFKDCSRLAHIWCKVVSPSTLSPTNLPSLSTTNLVSLYVSDKEAYENDVNWRGQYVNETFGNRIFKGEMRTVPYKGMWYVCASESQIATLYLGKNETEIEIPEPDELKDEKNVTYTVTGIDRNAFYGYSNIRRLTISNSVKTIGSNAFWDCSNLSHVYCKVVDPEKLSPANLPGNEMMTLYVSSSACQTNYLDAEKSDWSTKFKNRIYVGEMSPVFNNGMWYICASESNEATLYTGKNEENIPIIIPETFDEKYTVTGIDKGAFSGFSKIVSVTIPATVTAIGPEAFKNCSSLAYIYTKIVTPFTINSNVFGNKNKAILYIPTNSNYDGDENNVIKGWEFINKKECNGMEVFQTNEGISYVGWTEGESTHKAILIKGITGSSNETFVISSPVNSQTITEYSVIAIGDNAFNGVGGFKNLTISAEIESIGANAFRGRTTLQTVSLPSTLKAIGDNAFNGCTSLTDISYGDNPTITTIGASVFQGCTGLKLITLPASLTSIGDKAFGGCNNIVEIKSNMANPFTFPTTAFPDDNIILYVLPNDAKTSYTSNGWDDSKFLHVFQGDKVSETDTSGKLTYVTTDSENEAILLTSDPTNETVDIGASNPFVITSEPQTMKTVIAIAKSAFLDNKNLTSVTIPSGIVTISKYAFKNCAKLNLKDVTLPSSLRTIGEYAFENNTALTKIDIPEGTNRIRMYAFKRCSNLADITLPATLTTLEDYAFDQCGAITRINSKIPGDNLFELKEHVFSPYIAPIVEIYVVSGVGKYKETKGWENYSSRYFQGQKTVKDVGGWKYEYYSEGSEAKLIFGGGTESIVVLPTITIDGKEYNITEIGDDAFVNTANKANITSLTIGENVKIIGSNAFKGFSGLSSITLPAGIIVIGKSAFEDNTSLQSVVFPENPVITTIGASAFKGCTSLKISLPTSLKSIGDNAFENNTSLALLNIPNGVEIIGIGAFKGCKDITSISLPTSLKSIGDNAFENNTALTNIDIPEGTKTIGEASFKKCSSLTSVTLPSTLTKIDVEAFYDCSTLKTIISKIEKENIFEIDESVFRITGSDNVSPEKVYTSAELFVPIYEIPEVDPNQDPAPTPETLKTTEAKYRENGAWDNFLHYFEGEKLLYDADNNLTYEYLTGKHWATLVGTKFTSAVNNDEPVVIPGELLIGEDPKPYRVIAIAKAAFGNNENAHNIKKVTILADVDIPDFKYKIEADAFKGCTGLSEVELPSNLTIIGNNAFQNCCSLNQIELPSDLTTIGDNAFQNCSSLSKIELPSGLTTIGDNAFNGCSNIKSLYFPSNLKSIGKSAFQGCSGLMEVELPSSLSTIGESAFRNCTNLQKVWLPSMLTDIGQNAFNGCNSITNVCTKIVGNPPSINENVFSLSAGNTATLFVPKGQMTYYSGSNWVSKISNLVEGEFVDVYKGTAGDEKDMTFSCYTFEKEGVPSMAAILTKSTTTSNVVNIPASISFDGVDYAVNVIGAYAFSGRTSMKTLTLPASLTAIGLNAFTGCTGLKEIDSKITDPFQITKDAIFPNNEITLYVPGEIEPYTSKGWSFNPIYRGARIEIKIDNITYLYAENEADATIIKGETTIANLSIPSKVPDTDKNVTVIADNAFCGNTKLENLTLPEGLTTVGTNAFRGCSTLKTLWLPASLSTIGNNAFENCNNLIVIQSKKETPVNIKDRNVFSSYTAALYVPKDHKGDYNTAGWTFENKHEGERIEVPSEDGITYVYASEETSAIILKSASTAKNITIPLKVPGIDKEVDVTAIDKSAFEGNKNLENLELQEGLTTVGTNAFKGCSNLKMLWLPASLSTIGNNAFESCNNLAVIQSKRETPVDIKDRNVFSDYTAALYVPKNHKGDYNTAGWTFDNKHEGERKEVTSDDGLTYVYATEETDAVLTKAAPTDKNVTVPDKVPGTDKIVKEIAASAFMGNTTIEKLTLSEGLVNVGASAFKNCTKLNSMNLPSSVTSIGNNAFEGCIFTLIESKIDVPADIKERNVFTDYSATLYVPKSHKKDYADAGWSFADIHEGVRTEVTSEGLTYVYASEETFAMLTKGEPTEKTVTIPKNVPGTEVAVTTIAESAFSGNTTIETLKFEDGVTLTSIGANAFKGCKNIKKVWLPASLTTIEEKAFDGCNSIAYICTTNGTPLPINSNVFSTYTATLFVPEGKKKDYSDQLETWGQFPVIREGLFVDAITKDKISYECFTTGTGETLKQSAVLVKSATTSADVTIPSSIELEEDGAKYNVTSIAEYAFSSNTKLVNLTIPETIGTIGDNTFNGCSNLAVIVSNIVKPCKIASNVFSDYSATLYIPANSTVKDYSNNGWNFTNIFVGERKEVTLDDGMTFVYSTGDKKAMLTKVNSTDKDFTVPGSFKLEDVDYTVTAIGKNVFKDNKKIVNLTISENIVNIGAGAYLNCTTLKKVELPSTLDKIGDNAFDGCTAIAYICSKNTKSIDLGSSVFSTVIKETARLYVPKGSISAYSAWNAYFANILEGELKVVTDGDMTYYCVAGPNTATLVEAKTSDAEVTISNEVKYDNVTYIVTEIGDYAFSGISSLQKVVIGDSITTIGVGAFRNCSKLKEVVIPAGVNYIGDKAFEKCDRLALVVSHIEKPFDISEDVFPQVSAKLNVPDGTKELYEKAKGWNVFSTILQGDMKEAEVDGMTYQYVTGDKVATLIKGATKEKVLTIPTSVTIDGTPYEIKTINESALANISTIESLYISEGIDSIADNAFRNCANLNKVSLPATLRKLGDNAFSKCDKLIHIETAIKTPISISENVFTETTYANATLYVPVGTSAQYAAAEVWKKFKAMLEGSTSEVKVEGMTYICVPNLKVAKLTKGLDKPSVVKVPSKIFVDGKSYYVVGIERSAFYGLSNLEKVIIPDSVKTIGMEAFKNCSKLNTIELPSTLQSIGEKAFENCSKLTLVVCASATPATIFENTFPANAISINVPLGAKEAYQSANYWGSDNFTIYDSMSSLSEGDETKEEAPATYQIITDDESSSTTLAIVDDVNVSGDFAIPATLVHNGTEYPVTAIAPNTFENNINLTSVTIPSSINSIGESAFAGCSNLKSIIVNWTEPLNLSAPAAARGLMTRSGGSSIFEGVDKDNCVLYVPDGSVDAYKAAEVWKDFKNIKPISTAAIRDLIINGMPFDVYDLQGRKVRQNVTTLKGLPSGIYIVNGKKVSVRR